jgi:27-O-demethylrifamycin SV methyltransferase
MTTSPFDPTFHYDRVTAAWKWLLGEELHYGLFRSADEALAVATEALTDRMAAHAGLGSDVRLLDVGCGTGAPACEVARRHGCRVVGISTSAVGVQAARDRAKTLGLTHLVSFEVRDGMNNGFADGSFDSAWALESSHLMPGKDRLIAECARVLRPAGRLVICDIVLRAPMPLPEVLKRRDDFLLLRDVFGQAKMEPLEHYGELMRRSGLEVRAIEELSAETFPTFARWRENAERHRQEVVASIGETSWSKFVDSCGVLENLWREAKLGYGLIAAEKAVESGR